MSDSERPDLTTFRELEALVRNLGDELTAMRRRALLAEARLKEGEEGGKRAGGKASVKPKLADRISRLERENARLRERLEQVRKRSKAMLDRVHFLRQQAQTRERR